MPCGYRIDGTRSYGFRLGESYDPSRELIIDPLLPYATYLGGSGNDSGHGITADAEGCAYITGLTMSADFPVTPGAFQITNHGNGDAFVCRIKFTMYAKASVVITKL